MIDTALGNVSYPVLSFGGFIGMSHKMFAVQWKAPAVDGRNNCLRLNVDKERPKNARRFDKNRCPDLADRAFTGQVHGDYR